MAKRNLEVELIKSAAAYRRALSRLAVFFDAPPRPDSREEALWARYTVVR